MINPEDVFKIGQFAKPHGIKGEITLLIDYDVSDSWDESEEEPFIICDMDGILVPFFIEDYRYKGNTSLLIKLEDVNTEADAREFSNRAVYYPLDKVDPEELAGEITWDNFIGFTVIDENKGEIGEITHVDDTTLNVLLQIDHNGQDILLPAAEELIKEVDYEKRMRMKWKKGKAKENKLSFWKRIRFKYKLSFINESTLEEVWAFRLSQLSVFITFALFAFSLVAFTAFIIIMTPIRNYLPGYLDVEVRKSIMDNALRADSLERMIQIQDLYLRNVTGIISGDIQLDSIRQIESLARSDADYNIPRSEEELEYIKSFEQEEKYNLTVLNTNPAPVEGIFFYKPVNGIISSHYQSDIHHFGVDIAANPKESVLATLAGTVIYAGYDPNHGNVIQIQHKNGFVSVYKHNELLLKEPGEQVIAGEAIALVGNTGSLSTGPHLHFELWYNGKPVNPEDFIVF